MARDNLTPLGTKFSLLSSLACCPDKELVSPKSTSLLLSGRGGGDHSVKRKKVPSIKYNLHLNRSHHIYIYKCACNLQNSHTSNRVRFPEL